MLKKLSERKSMLLKLSERKSIDRFTELKDDVIYWDFLFSWEIMHVARSAATLSHSSKCRLNTIYDREE
jgi:hypothetical protein